tara:strand:+ start:6285 stop:6800 length:516 start_codon:yes stop_codon:yes gene_type:complete
MILLKNGRGQLGTILADRISKSIYRYSIKDIFIYHTWDMANKNDEEIQKNCLSKFKIFVDENKDNKIVFISTYSEQNNLYNLYKQKAEGYLLANHDSGIIIKLPVLLGKGICQKLKDKKVDPYGDIELMTLEEAATSIIFHAGTKNKNRNRIYRLSGTNIPATLVSALLHF